MSSRCRSDDDDHTVLQQKLFGCITLSQYIVTAAASMMILSGASLRGKTDLNSKSQLQSR
jgi:hypothetical protein